MQDWTDDDYSTLRRLIEKAKNDPEFTAEDVAALRKMSDAFRGIEAFGRVGKWLIFLLAALAGAMTAWEQVTTKVGEWLGG